jgi:thiol:disulfide interchange protein
MTYNLSLTFGDVENLPLITENIIGLIVAGSVVAALGLWLWMVRKSQKHVTVVVVVVWILYAALRCWNETHAKAYRFQSPQAPTQSRQRP